LANLRWPRPARKTWINFPLFPLKLMNQN
jgi:hypothetical protein